MEGGGRHSDRSRVTTRSFDSLAAKDSFVAVSSNASAHFIGDDNRRVFPLGLERR